MPLVSSRPLCVTYHANRASCASCCALTFFVAAILLPYAAAVAFGGMWTRESLVREQPLVNFRHEVLVEAVTKTAASEAQPLAWSTSSEVNAALGATLRPCELRAWSQDDERDGLPDKLEFLLRVPLDLAAGERLLSISVMLGVGVEFATKFRMSLDGALHLQHSSPLPGSRWRQTADLQLRSRDPQAAPDMGVRSACQGATSALQEPLGADGGPITIEAILERYETARCNDTVVLAPSPPLWTAGVTDSFEARLTVRVPPVLTTRRPGLVETLKLGFVQYLAMFIPVRAVLQWLYNQLISTGVLAARVHHPIKQHRF